MPTTAKQTQFINNYLLSIEFKAILQIKTILLILANWSFATHNSSII